MFVKSNREIIQNVLTLEGYRRSEDPLGKKTYDGLIAKGLCFVAYGAKSGVYFGPSRFIGYKNNTLDKHRRNQDKDGRETNTAIKRILESKFEKSALMEKQFKIFCANHGIEPAKHGRKYIETGKVSLNDNDFLLDDLAKLQSQPNLKETEKRRLIDARIGQGDFRKALIHYWRQCPGTGCRETVLLRASHIKPWREANNIERLDPYNGILLSPNLDTAFDAGLISFTSAGRICISRTLNVRDAKSLGITKNIRASLDKKHLPYMEYHYRNVFQK